MGMHRLPRLHRTLQQLTVGPHHPRRVPRSCLTLRVRLVWVPLLRPGPRCTRGWPPECSGCANSPWSDCVTQPDGSVSQPFTRHQPHTCRRLCVLCCPSNELLVRAQEWCQNSL